MLLLEDEAGAGDGTAGGAGAGASDGAGDAGAGAGDAGKGSDDGAGAGGKSALAAGAALDDAAGGAVDEGKPGADGRPAWLPEKFWDPEAKAARAETLARSYAELERRFKGGVDLPPKEAKDYKIEPVDGETLPAMDEAITAEFQKFAHEAGLNSKQYNATLRQQIQVMNRTIDGMRTAQHDLTMADLLQSEGNAAGVAKVQRLAYKAFARVATPEEMAAIDSMPDDPVLLRVLSKLGAALGEDRAPAEAQQSQFATLTQEADALLRDRKSDYFNSIAPGHERAMAKVTAWLAECERRQIADPLQYRLQQRAA